MEIAHIRPSPEAFKALAHPLRLRLLGLMRAEGPATASRLAERLGTSSGLTSYHLRALAKAGFIVDAPNRGTGRDRWWEAAHEATVWRREDFAEDPEAEAMADVLVGDWEAMRSRAVGQFESGRKALPVEWRRAADRADRSDLLMYLTPAELERLHETLMEVMVPYMELSLSRRDGEEPMPPSAKPVLMFLTAVPVADFAAVLGGSPGRDGAS